VAVERRRCPRAGDPGGPAPRHVRRRRGRGDRGGGALACRHERRQRPRQRRVLDRSGRVRARRVDEWRHGARAERHVGERRCAPDERTPDGPLDRRRRRLLRLRGRRGWRNRSSTSWSRRTSTVVVALYDADRACCRSGVAPAAPSAASTSPKVRTASRSAGTRARTGCRSASAARRRRGSSRSRTTPWRAPKRSTRP
jgi:hypothetical protein